MQRTPNHNKKMHDGWTPTYSVLFHQLNAFQEILRHLCGQHGRERWRTETQRKQGIALYLNRWTDKANQYNFSQSEKSRLLQRTGTNPNDWRSLNELDAVSTSSVAKEIKLIKKHMHGRQRCEERKRMQNAKRTEKPNVLLAKSKMFLPRW